MLVLALDSSLAACSAALLDPDRGSLLASDRAPMERGHAERLPVMVRDVVREAGARMADIGRIAVTTGPGSFTGVRIGLALARGLALALPAPIVGLTTLQALRCNLGTVDAPVAAAIDAHRGEIYLALFGPRGEPLLASLAARLDEAPHLVPDGALVVGTGATPLIEAAAARGKALRNAVAGELPDAASFVRLAAKLAPDAAVPQPLYLRAPDARPPAPVFPPR